jgi:molecular chaperone DnaK
MKAEAAANADADKKVRETADAINKGEAIAFSNEKMLEDQKDNVNADEKAKIEGLIKDMREAVANKNVTRINEIEEEFKKAWESVSQRVYSSQQAQTQTENTTTADETYTDGQTQDAEFEEVN